MKWFQRQIDLDHPISADSEEFDGFRSLDFKVKARTTCLFCLVCTSGMWVLCSQLISEDLGLKLEIVKPDMLGSAKRVTVSKDDIIILDGGGDKKDIEEQCEQVQSIFS